MRLFYRIITIHHIIIISLCCRIISA